MRRKILVKNRLYVPYTTLGVAVQCGDYRGYIFAVCRLVVREEMSHDGRTCFCLSHFPFNRYARRKRPAGEFLKVIQTPIKDVVPARVASQNINHPIAIRGPQLAQQDFLKHLSWRFTPALILVGADTLAAHTVNNMIFSIEMRGPEWSKQ